VGVSDVETTEKRLDSLPKWAQNYIDDLICEAMQQTKHAERIEAMLPWTKDGMDWFTIFRPPHRADEKINIFTRDKSGTIRLCALGKQDFLFIGGAP